MGSRGRKSAAEIAFISGVGITSTRRLSPPPDPTEEQAEVWRGIVNAHPGDWFGPGSAPVLAALCRHVTAGRRVAGWIARLEAAEDGLDEERWFKLLARQEAESKAVAALATRLRLTPQSRYTPHGAATAGRGTQDGPRPWET